MIVMKVFAVFLPVPVFFPVCLFLDVLTARQNKCWKNLAKLVGIQINSLAWGSSTPPFHKCDPQITSYELQTFLTSLFLQLLIFWIETKTSCGVVLWLQIGLQMILPYNIFCGVVFSTNEYPEFVCPKIGAFRMSHSV